MSSQLTMVVMMRTGRMIYNSLPARTGVLKLFCLFFYKYQLKDNTGGFLLSAIIKGNLTACFSPNAKRLQEKAAEQVWQSFEASITNTTKVYHQYHLDSGSDLKGREP